MSKPEPILDDMPLHIKSMIFDNLDWKNKVHCRLVSRSIKAVVENLPIFLPALKFSSSEDYATFEFSEDVSITFMQNKNRIEVVDFDESISKIQMAPEKTIVHYALDALTRIFNTFKSVHIENLHLEFERGDEVPVFVETFREKLNVTNLTLLLNGDLLQELLELFQPGTLRFLEFDGNHESYDFSRIVRMEVFQKLHIFETNTFLTGIKDEPEHLLHLDYYSLMFKNGLGVHFVKTLKENFMKKADGHSNIYIRDCDMEEFFLEFGQFDEALGFDQWEFQNGEAQFCIIPVHG